MRTFMASLTLLASFTSVSAANNRECRDTAIVLTPSSVEITWCCPVIPSVNLYGTTLQRMSEHDPVFADLPFATCICRPPEPCMFLDTTVTSGIWYYRVKEVYLDGTVFFRPPMQVQIASTSAKELIISNFELGQNYPNPFNPKTSFRFQVPSFELVTLKVFDLLGREVATLVNEVKGPRIHEVTWDASGVASGMYFYRLTAGGFVQTRKAILLR